MTLLFKTLQPRCLQQFPLPRDHPDLVEFLRQLLDGVGNGKNALGA
jgi:hypothetical protein